MPSTYEPIATVTVSNNTNSIVFNGITNAYTDLRIIAYTVSYQQDYFSFIFNDDAGANYSNAFMDVSNTFVAGVNGNLGSMYFAQRPVGPANSVAMFTVDIASYAAPRAKTALITYSLSQGDFRYYGLDCGVWRNTNAVTKITCTGAWGVGSTVTLFGIKAA